MEPKIGCIPTRFIALFMVCFYLFCAFANYNCIGSLQQDIMDIYHLDTFMFGVLYSMSTWPSLLDVVYGYVIDRYLGLRMATIIFSISIIIAASLNVVATFVGRFWFLLLTRFLQGIAGNPLIMCCNGYIIYWFKEGKEVNLAYSLHESVIWLGTSAIYLCSENVLALFKTKYNQFYSLAITIGSEVFTLLTLRIIALTTLVVLTPSTKPKKSEENSDTTNEPTEKKHTNWKHYLSFTPLFWFFASTCFLFFFVALNFISLSQEFLKNKYDITIEEANYLSALLTLIVFVAAPIVGILLDYIGQNLTFLTGALLLSTISFLLLSYGNHYSPYLPIVLLGLSISMSSSCWSLFANIVKEHQVMVAYGVAQTGMCASNGIGSIISGVVVDKFGYHGLAINFLIISVCGLIQMIIVMFLNYKSGNPLNKWRLKKKIKSFNNLSKHLSDNTHTHTCI